MLTPDEFKRMEMLEAVETAMSGETAVDVDTDQRQITGTAHEDTDFLKGKVAEILGEDKLNYPKFDTELAELISYAQSKGAKSNEDILWEIRYLANRLGTPGYGENRIKFLYQYVYLSNEDMRIQNSMKKMERING